MPAVLTAGSTLKCAHQGTVSTSGSSKLKVDGNDVLILAGLGAWSIGPECTNKGGSLKPCTKVVPPPAAGVATKLIVDGSPAILDTLSVITDSTPAPPGLVTAQSANQNKLVAS